MNYSNLRPAGTLTWSRLPHAETRTYTLKQDVATVGTLRWQKKRGSLVLGETKIGSWSFKRVGFFSTKVSVRTAESEQEIAAFYPSPFGGGWAEFGGSRLWRLTARGLFKQTYEFIDTSGRVGLTLRPSGDDAEVILSGLSLDESTAGLLALMMWYVVLLAADDASTTAVLVAAIS